MKSWPPTPSRVRRRPRALAIVFALFALSLAPTARAQVSLSATGETSYRFRGVDLTNGKPDVRVALSYDHRSGAYGGGAVIIGEGSGGATTAIGYAAYAGFARRASNGVTWDAGATTTKVVSELPVAVTYRIQGFLYSQTYIVKYQANYAEAYVGAAKGPLSAHLYLSPDYLGQGLRTAYLDLNAAVRPTTGVRLFVHAGLLAPLGDSAPPAVKRERLDLRTGVAVEFRHGEIQLAWTTVTPRADYPTGYPQKRNALVLSASAFF